MAFLNSPYRYPAAGLVAMAAGMGIGRFVYTPILPAMMQQLGLSSSDAGLIASGNYVGYLLGAVIAAGGWAQGRERSLMLLALIANALLLLAMGWTETVWAFTAIRLLAGVASAFMMIFLTSLIAARLATIGRPDLQVVHFAGVGLGIALSSLMTGYTIGEGARWDVAWMWSAGAAFVAVLIVLALVDRRPAVAGAAVHEPKLPRERALTLVILSYGLFGVGYIVTATFLLAIVRATGSDPHLETWVWFATGIVAAPSFWFWFAVSKKVGMAWTYAIACIIEAFGVVASVSIGGSAALILAGVLFGGTFLAITVIGLQIGRMLAPQSPRRVLALMTASFGIGQIVGPIVAGIMADMTGNFVLPSIGAGLILVAAGLIVAAARPLAK